MKKPDIIHKLVLRIILIVHRNNWTFSSVKTQGIETYYQIKHKSLSPLSDFTIIVDDLKAPLKYQLQVNGNWGDVWRKKLEDAFEQEIVQRYNDIYKKYPQFN
ncbi:MAG: hypothetical protein MJZ20_12385 [Bacteroidaceae bacterium]|nr:hypothetical protein [Bacteroidaceae bacterium]